MPTTACIPDDVLQSLILGEFSDELAAPWEAHLLDCPDCLSRVRGARSADTLMNALQTKVAEPLSPQETHAVDALIKRITDRRLAAQSPAFHDVPTSLSAVEPVTSSNTQPINPSQGAVEFVAEALFGPYRILAKLGEGGMGAVYKATHTRLDKVVALKVLSPQMTQQPESIARFEREMKAVGKLEHPHIVRAMDAGDIQGTHYLAMEYVEGSDLAAIVKQGGPLSVVNACQAVHQTALALAAAHAKGLIHRDLKPSNLLIDPQGHVKLLDLGLARLADDTSAASELTTAGQAFGTPDYMAPEQWEDAHGVDARTDLYALGCTLYYLLVGHAPYATDQYRSAVAKLKGHVTDPSPDLKSARPDVPDELAAIYKRLLEKSPADRFQTAADVAEALAPFTSPSTKPVATPPVPTECGEDSFSPPPGSPQ